MLGLPPNKSERGPILGRVRKMAVCLMAAGTAFCAPLALQGCGGAGAPGSVPQNGATASSVLPPVHAGAKTVKPRDITANYDTTVLNDTPLAFYRMNDTTSTLTDAGPNAVNGTYGSAVALGVPGLTSPNYTAASFPGGNYDPTLFAQVLPTAQLQPSVVSVEAWVDASALNSANRYQPIVAYGNYRTGTSYQLTITPINQFFFSVHTATASPSVVATTTSTPGQIFHIIGTYDGTGLKLYINGVLQGQGSATGAINYGGVLNWTGLAVASGFDPLTNHPLENYAGTIADVSIYNYALTGTQVMNHYLAGVKTPPLTETPAWSDAFVNTIGVNAPFNYQNTVYDTQYSAVKSLLLGSGIRHIRAGLPSATWPTYAARLTDLAASGIHSDVVTQGTETASLIQSEAALAPTSIEAIEGPNEPDLSGNPNWLTATQAFMPVLYGAVKSDPAIATLPVIGASVVNPGDEAAIGNLSAYLDYGNIHPYYGTNNPGNTGTGSITPYGRSGSLQYFLGEASQISGSKPIQATETGYGTNLSIANNVSELCDGKEAPRTYFVHFQNGVSRTLPYQLVESGTAYGALGFFSYMGFLRQDLSPKPSYNAIAGLTALLGDQGSPFTPAPFTYTISGNVNNLAHQLLQKRNGTYYLALWLEVPSWNAATNTDINATPQNVTITVPNTVTSGSLATIADTGTLSSSPVTFSLGNVTVPVADRVTVLSFHL